MNRKPSSERALHNAIEAGTIAREDGELVREFLESYGTIKGLGKGSRSKYLYALKQLIERLHTLGATVPALREETALRLIRSLQEAGWSEDTRRDYWLRFTVFYKWASKKHGPWDPKVQALLTGEERYQYRIDKNKVERKGILTPEEVLQLVHTEADIAYKAFYSVLYEGGMRAGEALGLRIRDVEKTNGRGYTLHLRNSKTIRRPIPLLQFSVTYLEKWLHLHPRKADKDAPLFTNTLGEPLKNETANKRLRQLLKHTRIDRHKVSLHSFRHSRATELAAVLNEFQMCRLFGWQVGSRMPATYIRERALDVRGALLRGYGMEEQEARAPPGRACMNCEHLNPSTAEYCDNCTLPLDRERLEKLKGDVDAIRSQELLKKLLRETRADLIREVVLELKQQNGNGGNA